MQESGAVGLFFGYNLIGCGCKKQRVVLYGAVFLELRLEVPITMMPSETTIAIHCFLLVEHHAGTDDLCGSERLTGTTISDVDYGVQQHWML